MKRRAVFVGREFITRHIWEPLAKKFEKEGWETSYCADGRTQGDVGFYCEDGPLPGNQGFTVVTINGLDQDHSVRPEYSEWFNTENWGLFDLGILPGPRWMNGWLTRKPSFRNTPRLGVCSTGWFKGDQAVQTSTRLLDDLNVNTVLYAPQTEQDGKQRSVVDAISKTNLKLKIKHWEKEDYRAHYPWLLTDAYMENLRTEDTFANTFKNVEVVSMNENFMDVLKGADLLITDQSSVLYEAAMLNIPTLTCIGWKHACGECQGPQPSPDIAIAIEQDQLVETLLNIGDLYSNLLRKTEIIKSRNYAHLGISAEITYYTVEQLFASAPAPSRRYKRYTNTLVNLRASRYRRREKRLARKRAAER